MLTDSSKKIFIITVAILVVLSMIFYFGFFENDRRIDPNNLISNPPDVSSFSINTEYDGEFAEFIGVWKSRWNEETDFFDVPSFLVMRDITEDTFDIVYAWGGNTILAFGEGLSEQTVSRDGRKGDRFTVVIDGGNSGEFVFNRETGLIEGTFLGPQGNILSNTVYTKENI